MSFCEPFSLSHWDTGIAHMGTIQPFREKKTGLVLVAHGWFSILRHTNSGHDGVRGAEVHREEDEGVG